MYVALVIIICIPTFKYSHAATICDYLSNNQPCSHTNWNSLIAPVFSYTKYITMYVHCLHWLMSTDLLFQSAFSNHVNPQLVKWHLYTALIWLWEPDMVPTVGPDVPRPCSGILALCGYMNIATLNSVILLLCFSLCHHPHHPCTPPTHPLHTLA